MWIDFHINVSLKVVTTNQLKLICTILINNMDYLNVTIDKLTEELAETSYDGSYKLEEFFAIVKENITDFISAEGSEEDFTYAEEEIVRSIQESQPIASKKNKKKAFSADFFLGHILGAMYLSP